MWSLFSPVQSSSEARRWNTHDRPLLKAWKPYLVGVLWWSLSRQPSTQHVCYPIPLSLSRFKPLRCLDLGERSQRICLEIAFTHLQLQQLSYPFSTKSCRSHVFWMSPFFAQFPHVIRRNLSCRRLQNLKALDSDVTMLRTSWQSWAISVRLRMLPCCVCTTSKRTQRLRRLRG